MISYNIRKQVADQGNAYNRGDPDEVLVLFFLLKCGEEIQPGNFFKYRFLGIVNIGKAGTGILVF